MRTKNILKAAIAIGAMAQALPAFAQDAAPAPQERAAEDEINASDEIIVTARKRAETLQSVPVVAQAFRQDTLEQYGTNSIAALTARVPDLQAGTAVNSVGTQLSLRGVGTTALNATIDQSISLNIDGLSLTQGMAYSAGLFDVGQIEVLKGPQALFFGKNSPAGVISMRSADPTDKFEAIARVGYEFAADDKFGELVLSGPVTDWLKLRVAGRYSDMKGYFRNESVALPNSGTINPTDRRFPNAEAVIIRATALFEPSSSYTARLKFAYTNTFEKRSATSLDVGFCPDGTGGVAPSNIAFIGGDDCKLNNIFRIATPDPAAFPGARNNAQPFFKSRQLFGTLEQTLQLGDSVQLTSVTGYYHNDLSTIHLASSTGAAAVIIQDNDFYNDQFTQELRLESDFKDVPVNFMIGGFYQNATQMNHVRVRSNQVLALLPALLMSPRHYVDIKSISAFGQLTWNITPTLEFAAGARWTHEERDHEQYNFANPLAPVKTVLLNPHLESSNLSPEFTLAYRPTNNLTVFGSYKWGFKSGSFNSATMIGPTTNASFNDEKVQGAEIGVKARMGDLTLNVAAYRYLYADLQVGALELQQLPGGGGITYALRTMNAAGAKVQGIEVEGTYAPSSIPGLTLHAAANLNNARYGSFPNGPCGNGQTAAAGCNNLLSSATGRYTAQDLSGRRLVRAPDLTASFGFDYETDIGSNMSVMFGSNTTYTSEYSTTLVDLPGFEQGAFAKVGANIALRGPDKKWEIALIGNNLTNKYTTSLCFNTNLQNATVLGGQISGGTTNGAAGNDESACTIERGREVSLRLSFRF